MQVWKIYHLNSFVRIIGYVGDVVQMLMKKFRNFGISSSAIGQHLLHNQLCAQNYSDDKFSILAHGRTAFHLLTLEATYIKTSKPNLCKQKEFVYSLKISH